MHIELDGSIFEGPPLPYFVKVTACGYAIYYTSIAPLINPQIPPPFTVPAGQGVQWALPFTGIGFAVLLVWGGQS